MKHNPFHPDYGLPHEYRKVVLVDIGTRPVRQVALDRNIGVSTIYRWRKEMEKTND
jgi:transposase